MTFYSISKKSEDTKAFNWKIFFQQVLSLSVTFQVNHIGLQQWWSRVCKIKDSDFTVPRCTSHCFARLIFRNNIYVERKNVCKYVEQMVSTYNPNSENQFDWFKGVDMEVTVRNHIRQKLQNSKSQYISKIVRQIVRRRTIWVTEFRLQFQKVLLTKVTTTVCSNETTRTQSLKRYTENTSLSNIYQRFYRPGSYALRGVIDHYICLQMGAPLFLLAFFRRKLGSNFNCGSRYSLMTFNCYIALLKASRLIKEWRRSSFIIAILFLH